MSRQLIEGAIGRFFRPKELVCPHVMQKFGDAGLRFVDSKILETLYILRTDILGVPLTCNNYNADLTQRGLRCNCCKLVKSKSSVYMSAHVLGKALDLSSGKMTAAEMRKRIIANADKLPYPVRLEDDVTWLHIDVLNEKGEGANKVILFKG